MLNQKKSRETRHIEFNMKADDVKDDGSFSCYGAVFNNVDQGGDVIAPGAFNESLIEAKKESRLIPMLWQHDRQEPIGSWLDIKEDDNGLLMEGKILIDAGPLEKRAFSHLKNGSVGGFSIGYRLKEGGYEVHPEFDPDDNGGGAVWLLSNIDLRECSLVTMPMNLEARLVSVKNAMEAGGMPSPREFEMLLRDACGFTRSKAKEFTHLCRPVLRQVELDAKKNQPNQLLASLADALKN